MNNQCVGGYDNEAYYENESCQSDVNLIVVERSSVTAQTSGIDLDETVKTALDSLALVDSTNAVTPPSAAAEYRKWLSEAVDWVKT